MCETSDNAGSDRIARAEENDRDCFSRLLKSEKGRCTRGKDPIDLQSDQFHRELFGAQPSEVAVVGDFDADALAAQVSKELGDWKAAKPYTRVPRPFSQAAQAALSIETPDKANALFVAGLEFPMRDGDPNYPALVLGNYILGGAGFNSHLMTRIRIKEGVSYGTGSRLSADELDERGVFSSFAIYAPQNAARLEQLYKEEMMRAVNEDFTADEIEKAKSGWMQGRSVSRAQDRELVHWLTQKAYHHRTFAWDTDLEAKVMALTGPQIRAAMAKYIQYAKLTVVKAGDFARPAAPSAATSAR